MVQNRKLKAIIREVVAGVNKRAKKQLFDKLDDAVNNDILEHELIHAISNISTLRKFIEPDFMQYLETKYSDNEIMSMYAEWAGI